MIERAFQQEFESRIIILIQMIQSGSAYGVSKGYFCEVSKGYFYEVSKGYFYEVISKGYSVSFSLLSFQATL